MSLWHNKTIRISLISLLCSIIGILLIVKGQYDLGIQFKMADGKTQALYGLRTLGELKLIGFGAIAFLLALVSYFRKENRRLVLLSLIFAFLAMILPLTSLWKLWA